MSTGISTPSDVAQRMIATSSGVSTSPAAFSAQRDRERDREREREAEPREPQHRPAQPRRTRSPGRPGRAGTRARASRSPRSSRRPRPSRARDGPTTIPATISSTTDGQPHAREQAEQERRGEGDRRDDQEVAERGHGGESGSRPFRYGRFGARCWPQPPSPSSSRACARATSGRSRCSSPAITARCSSVARHVREQPRRRRRGRPGGLAGRDQGHRPASRGGQSLSDLDPADRGQHRHARAAPAKRARSPTRRLVEPDDALRQADLRGPNAVHGRLAGVPGRLARRCPSRRCSSGDAARGATRSRGCRRRSVPLSRCATSRDASRTRCARCST